MTADQQDPLSPTTSPPGEWAVASEDLTARARIREAAMKHFAEEGYERATIRGIAKTAGVSPGLLRHHFGSKDDLRKACDEYVSQALRRVNAEYLDNLGAALGGPPLSERLRRYVARALAEGSDSSAAMFDEMVSAAEPWLARADAAREEPPALDRRIRAALVTAMKCGIPLLHEQLSEVLGTDIFGPEGGRLLALGLLDIYSHPLISVEDAAAGKTGIG